MKKLFDYMIESEKQFVYRIKVAGEFPKEQYNKYKRALEMFDVDKCTAPKKTPVQEDPFGFPGLHNEEVHIFEVTLNYPANEEQLRELADRCGIEQNTIVITSAAFADSMNDEMEGVEDGTRLETPEYPEPSTAQQQASDDYADSYQKAAETFAGEASTDFEVAGGTTDPAKYNTDNENGKDSPMSKVKRLSIKDILK